MRAVGVLCYYVRVISDATRNRITVAARRCRAAQREEAEDVETYDTRQNRSDIGYEADEGQTEIKN